MYSQQGEDIYMSKHFFNKKVDDGFYVEIGAVDGVTYSNSKFFEDQLGYKGMLVEAQPRMFKQLEQNRPNNILINKAISLSIEPIIFLGNSPCGGIESHMTNNFKQNWHKHSERYIVNTAQFNKLFNNYKIKFIDFITIDVEGGEYDVLSTIDFNNVEIYVVCIELDGHNKEKDDKCRQMLNDNGFKLHNRLFINEFWVNDNYSRRDKLFDKTKQFSFSGISQNKTSNLGVHHFVEPHLIHEINSHFTR
jgi:FkbM family methyltransferase